MKSKIRTKKGFTLIELSVFGALIGLILLITTTVLSYDPVTLANYEKMVKVARVLPNEWRLIKQSCEIPSAQTKAIGTHDAAERSAVTNAEVLLGNRSVLSFYDDCYAQSGATALPEWIKENKKSGILGYPVELIDTEDGTGIVYDSVGYELMVLIKDTASHDFNITVMKNKDDSYRIMMFQK